MTPPTVSPQLERYIQTNLRSQLAQARQHVVQNQTAAVLELSTSLLNQTTAQAHRLTDMEAQVPGGERVASGGLQPARLAHSPGHLALTSVPGSCQGLLWACILLGPLLMTLSQNCLPLGHESSGGHWLWLLGLCDPNAHVCAGHWAEGDSTLPCPQGAHSAPGEMEINNSLDLRGPLPEREESCINGRVSTEMDEKATDKWAWFVEALLCARHGWRGPVLVYSTK